MSTSKETPRTWVTDALSHSESEVRFRRFQLTVTHGPDEGLARTSADSELAVGADGGNDLVLSDSTVSRHHFMIAARPDGFLLTDLESTNGTTIAGCRIGTALLRSGTTIVAGNTTLRFDC